MTYTDTLNTLSALRGALIARTAPTDELAERTATILAGAHARHLAGVADRHEAPAAALYEHVAQYLAERPLAAAAYVLAAQCAFLAADYPRTAALLAAADRHSGRHGGELPPLARLLKLDHRVSAATTT
ncbi:hypothetical protein [Mycolicibacterium sp. S3B2]|uniref:hypothetical protein n=1 Tax=Mycolicibacterium sp. S3B2 TaxID=3415120 RepID=UPI003C7A1C58